MRQMSSTVVSTPHNHHRQCSHDSRTSRSPTATKDANLGMSPVSRYNHNLKVLRRRDPSISSIFDQFSHVCVYHYNGTKWEKQGFEGSMFLYERDSYPPYGFYILNRMGTDDYIQRLYPEDDVSAHGSYLMLRSYPDFTSRRLSLARIASPNSGQIPHKFSDVYALQFPDMAQEDRKGRSQTVGLWMYATDAREPLIDVMLRLHSYVKKNLPYPEEFRYGPNRPPPPNPNARNGSQSPSKGHQSHSSAMASPSSLDLHATSQLPPERRRDTPSDLDLLFAKLDHTTTATESVTPGSLKVTPSLPHPPIQTSKVTSLGPFGPKPRAESILGYGINDSSPTLQIPSSDRGLSLLDKIFASASSSPDSSPTNGIKPAHTQTTKTAGVPPSLTTLKTQIPQQHATPSRQSLYLTESSPFPVAPSHYQTSNVHHSHPFLPKQPRSHSSTSNCEPIFPHPAASLVKRTGANVSSAPQNLTPDVILGLLGLGSDAKLLQPYTHTRSSSTSTNSSRLSRYSGDAEDEDEGGHVDSDAYSGFSHPSTVFEIDADAYEEVAPAHAPEAQHPPSEIPTLLKVNGDVTPRAPWRRSSLSKGDELLDGVSEHSRGHRLVEITRASPSPASRSQANPLSLPPANVTPFSSNLPTSTDTVRPNNVAQPMTSTVADHSRLPSGLDASGTSFLANNTDLWPESRVPVDDRTLDDDADIVELDFADTSALSNAEAFMSILQEKERARKAAAGLAPSGISEPISQLGKREQKQNHGPDTEKLRTHVPTAPAYSSQGETAQSPGMQSVSANGDAHKHTLPNSDAKHAGHSPLDRADGKQVANGRVTVKGHVVQVDRNAIQQSLLTVAAAGRLPSVSERNEFMRELLTLVHTDKTFVDDLWREYTMRVQK